ncbi:aspartate aminotransferase, cytoplasmic-like [Sitodiplosis mosellana]|uniref:aspartate aminotransferase, cytoplasmic-like n=1 Tax=Sitodiplosis mosellana TaxID=263140 RepID=UPI002444BEA7|nr:aspartate aminotransferase, cytoplasmic-like [Sitodiplosis mosellana]
MGIIEMESFFKNVVVGPPNSTLSLLKAFAEDKNPVKVNLCIGAYRTSDNQPYVLPVVRKTEARIVENRKINHEYLPSCGQQNFTTSAIELLLGEDSIAINENRVHGIQSISGTGALRLGAEFLFNVLGHKTVYMSNPTWENHERIFGRVGFTDIRSYRYWNSETRSVDIDGMLDDLDYAPQGAVVLLHACAHNPTGSDPTPDQWIRIANTIERKNLFVFFDSAYQGFASGDTNKDAFSVRYFISRGFELLCAQSFSKIFGLYAERVGCLIVVHNESSTIAAVTDQITNIIYDSYLNPPGYGACIIETVLNDNELYEEWQNDLKLMSNRIRSIRKSLYDELIHLKTPGSWNHIIDQIGMFSYTGLNENQVDTLINEHHVYLRRNGRISLCGLNESNVTYVAKAIHAAITSISN